MHGKYVLIDFSPVYTRYTTFAKRICIYIWVLRSSIPDIFYRTAYVVVEYVSNHPLISLPSSTPISANQRLWKLCYRVWSEILCCVMFFFLFWQLLYSIKMPIESFRFDKYADILFIFCISYLNHKSK